MKSPASSAMSEHYGMAFVRETAQILHEPDIQLTTVCRAIRCFKRSRARGCI